MVGHSGGIHFYNGKAHDGGAPFAVGNSDMNLELCHFSSCPVKYNGGAIGSYDENAALYATPFSGNYAQRVNPDIGSVGDDGYDIYTIGTVIVHDTCPDGYIGAPIEGAAIDKIAFSSTYGFYIPNDPKLYSKGTCKTCPTGKAGNTPSSCVNCPDGTRTEAGNYICVDCIPGTHGTTPVTDQCTTCTGSTYTSSINQLSCANCTSGTWANIDNSGCTSSYTRPLDKGNLLLAGLARCV